MTDETVEEKVENPEAPDVKDDAAEEAEETAEEKNDDTAEEVESDNADDKTEEILADGVVETPREKALREALTETRRELAGKRTQDFLGGEKKVEVAKPVEKNSALSKYKKEDIETLREVLPVIADELGYARKADIQQTDYDKQASVQVDTFLEKHPEYKPENDKDGVLWTKLVNEFNGTYQKPKNPISYGKLLERVHSDMFGATVSKPSLQDNAAREKIKVASHSGASASPTRREGMVRNSAAQGMRFDALKGFSEAEIAALEERSGK